MRNLKVPPSPYHATMGFDKDKDTPRKPVLAARTFNRAPLTPKIATAGASRTFVAVNPPLASPNVAIATPLARRATAGSTHSGRDDIVVASPLLGNHVTPRSGTRQNRVDSGHTTPNGTPTHADRGHSTAATPNANAGGSDSKFFYASDAKSTVGTQPHPSPSLAPMQRASTFVYASGRSQHPPPSPSQPSVRAAPTVDLSSKFMHANGAALDRHAPPPLRSTASPMLPSTTTPKLASSRSGTPHGTPTAAGFSAQQQQQQHPLSPMKMPLASPFSMQKSSSGSFSAHTRSPAPSSMPSTPGACSPSGSHHADSLPRQRTSIGSGGRNSISGHSRQGSLTIADPPAVARLLHSSQSGSETSSPASSQFPTAAATTSSSSALPSPAFVIPTAVTNGIAAMLQASADLASEEEDSASSRRDEPLQSPTKQPGSPAQEKQMDDLVVTARRERKVQDLEITNASLEAINRSLERQLRKQKTELRQFRRLSRSGRLFLAPSTASRRITSSSTVEGPLQDPERILSVLSEDESAWDESVYDDADDDASEMETSLTSEPPDSDVSGVKQDASAHTDGGVAAGTGTSDHANVDAKADAVKLPDMDSLSSSDERTQRWRKRDERRLQLDLSKHRQLLVDSQKINQSIKRCLSWTDTLIEEGRRALAFQVRVSEIKLGGRVLAADELEDTDTAAERPTSRDVDSTVEGSVKEDPGHADKKIKVDVASPHLRKDDKFVRFDADPSDGPADGGPTSDPGPPEPAPAPATPITTTTPIPPIITTSATPDTADTPNTPDATTRQLPTTAPIIPTTSSIENAALTQPDLPQDSIR